MESSEIRRGGWLLGHGGRGEIPGSGRRDAARNRRGLLEAARRLFEERGVAAVTMEDVARAAGVGKGTLYRNFSNKGALCETLLDDSAREFQWETLRALGDSGQGALEKLDWFLDRLVRFTDANLELLYGGQESLCSTDRIARYAHPASDWPRATVLGLLRAAEVEGEIGAGLDVEYLAEALLAPLEPDLFYYQRRVRGHSPDRISAGLRSLTPRPL